MNRMIIKWILWGFVFVLFSCETMQQQDYFFNEIVVRNRSYDPVQDVEIRVDKTHRVFSCTNIAPRASCSNSFHKRKYQHNPIQVTWTYHNRKRTMKEFVLEVPGTLNPERPLRGVLEIKPDGTIATYFEQQ